MKKRHGSDELSPGASTHYLSDADIEALINQYCGPRYILYGDGPILSIGKAVRFDYSHEFVFSGSPEEFLGEVAAIPGLGMEPYRSRHRPSIRLSQTPANAPKLPEGTISIDELESLVLAVASDQALQPKWIIVEIGVSEVGETLLTVGFDVGQLGSALEAWSTVWLRLNQAGLRLRMRDTVAGFEIIIRNADLAWFTEWVQVYAGTRIRQLLGNLWPISAVEQKQYSFYWAGRSQNVWESSAHLDLLSFGRDQVKAVLHCRPELIDNAERLLKLIQAAREVELVGGMLPEDNQTASQGQGTEEPTKHLFRKIESETHDSRGLLSAGQRLPPAGSQDTVSQSGKGEVGLPKYVAKKPETRRDHKLVYQLWLQMKQEYRDDVGFSDVVRPTLEVLRDRAMHELDLEYTTRRLRDIVKSGDEGYLR